jgi:hypothetical protein
MPLALPATMSNVRMGTVLLVCLLAACNVGTTGGPGPGNNQVDAAQGNHIDAPNHSPIDSPVGATCPLPANTSDTGALSATTTQKCNVAGSMGQKHWYRMAAALPSGAMDYVQLELWDGTGPFVGGTVTTGTFQITGADAAYNTCGVCVRGMGDKGAAGQKEYFATSGTVQVTAVGTTLAATLTNIGLVEVDANHAPVTGGCADTVASTQVSGTVVAVTMGQCPAGVAD